MKFSQFECRNDIYHEIDDLVKLLRMKYTELESKNNNIKNTEMIK